MQGRICRLFIPLALILCLATAVSAQIVTPNGVVGQRWEASLTTPTALGCGNRSRVPVLESIFTSPTGVVYKGYGFWSGARTFKIRAMFPTAGTWKWRSNFISNGCGSHPALTVSTDQVFTVSAAPLTKPALYTKGALKLGPGAPARYLVHANNEKFYWLGDTSWTFYKATPANWTTYLATRKSQGFSVIQVSMPTSGSTSQNTDNNLATPFNAGACTSASNPLPNTCSELNPAFWNEFERKIEEANQAGFQVVVIGLFKRVTDGVWPATVDSQWYARNVVARLVGNHVIFSPGFDELPVKTNSCEDTFTGANCDARNTNKADCGTSPCPTDAVNEACRARNVGRTIRDSLIRNQSTGVRLYGLVTHHFGGGCKCAGLECTSDYFHKKFELEDWLDFTLFQAGQGKNCFGAGATAVEKQTNCMAQRARQRPFDIYYRNTKANVNGEGIYDNGFASPALYSDYTARQSGYLSTLSGAFGYTFGVHGIWNWGQSGAPAPSVGWGSASSTQMKHLCSLFRNLAWERLKPPAVNRVVNQSTVESTKIAYAHDTSAQFAVAYMPIDASRPAVTLDLSDTFYSPGAWCHKWLNPATGVYSDSTTAPSGSGSTWTFTKPDASKDWVLVTKSGGVCTPAQQCPF